MRKAIQVAQVRAESLEEGDVVLIGGRWRRLDGVWTSATEYYADLEGCPEDRECIEGLTQVSIDQVTGANGPLACPDDGPVLLTDTYTIRDPFAEAGQEVTMSALSHMFLKRQTRVVVGWSSPRTQYVEEAVLDRLWLVDIQVEVPLPGEGE